MMCTKCLQCENINEVIQRRLCSIPESGSCVMEDKRTRIRWKRREKMKKKGKRKESNSLKRRKWRIQHCGNSPEGRLVQTKFR